MRVLVALDKFKGSLTASEACGAVVRGLSQKHPDWSFDVCPLTDGGEGFAEVMTMGLEPIIHHCDVTGPLYEEQRSHWYEVDLDKAPEALKKMCHFPPSGRLAVIEMAEASGLLQVPASLRDPFKTTSRGTGDLIAHAIEAGMDAVLLGIGGSASNDLGLGALTALGLKCQDVNHQKMHRVRPLDWDQIVKLSGDMPVHMPTIAIACDVENPLLGPRGATAVYGPQKGLKEDAFMELESRMAKMAKTLCEYFDKPEVTMKQPSMGAAGGIMFGLHVASGALRVPGMDCFVAALGLEERLKKADLIITGEGRWDASSLEGKGPGYIWQRASEMQTPVRVFAGQIDLEGEHLYTIAPEGYSSERSHKEAATLLAAAAESLDDI